MSKRALAEIVARMAEDHAFAELVRSDPDTALAGYTLTVTERRRLAKLDIDHSGSDAFHLTPRMSKSGIGGMSTGHPQPATQIGAVVNLAHLPPSTFENHGAMDPAHAGFQIGAVVDMAHPSPSMFVNHGAADPAHAGFQIGALANLANLPASTFEHHSGDYGGVVDLRHLSPGTLSHHSGDYGGVTMITPERVLSQLPPGIAGQPAVQAYVHHLFAASMPQAYHAPAAVPLDLPREPAAWGLPAAPHLPASHIPATVSLHPHPTPEYAPGTVHHPVTASGFARAPSIAPLHPAPSIAPAHPDQAAWAGIRGPMATPAMVDGVTVHAHPGAMPPIVHPPSAADPVMRHSLGEERAGPHPTLQGAPVHPPVAPLPPHPAGPPAPLDARAMERVVVHQPQAAPVPAALERTLPGADAPSPHPGVPPSELHPQGIPHLNLPIDPHHVTEIRLPGGGEMTIRPLSTLGEHVSLRPVTLPPAFYDEWRHGAAGSDQLTLAPLPAVDHPGALLAASPPVEHAQAAPHIPEHRVHHDPALARQQGWTAPAFPAAEHRVEPPPPHHTAPHLGAQPPLHHAAPHAPVREHLTPYAATPYPTYPSIAEHAPSADASAPAAYPAAPTTDMAPQLAAPDQLVRHATLPLHPTVHVTPLTPAHAMAAPQAHLEAGAHSVPVMDSPMHGVESIPVLGELFRAGEGLGGVAGDVVGTVADLGSNLVSGMSGGVKEAINLGKDVVHEADPRNW